MVLLLPHQLLFFAIYFTSITLGNCQQKVSNTSLRNTSLPIQSGNENGKIINSSLPLDSNSTASNVTLPSVLTNNTQSSNLSSIPFTSDTQAQSSNSTLPSSSNTQTQVSNSSVPSIDKTQLSNSSLPLGDNNNPSNSSLPSIIQSPNSNLTNSPNATVTENSHVDQSIEPNSKNDTISHENSSNPINLFARRVGHSLYYGKPQQMSSDESIASNNKTQTAGDTLPTVIWSPFSVHQALVPLLFAADGKTKEELQSLLFSNETGNFRNTDSNVTAPTPVASNVLNVPSTGGNKGFYSVTSLFAGDNLPLNENFVRELQSSVTNVEVKSIDFSNVSNAVQKINSWVRDSTDGLINDVVDQSQMDPTMVLMIVNCVKFKGLWTNPFKPKLTKLSNFYGANGVEKVEMMKQTSTVNFGELSGDYTPQFSVMEMPYSDSDLVSLFILPTKTSDIHNVMGYLGHIGVSNIRQKLSPTELDVFMPKFKINSDVDIMDSLEKNGLETVFNPRLANLTKMITSSNNSLADFSKNVIMPLYVSKIFHKTIFEVSEEGTQAGAVTGVSIIPLTALSQPKTFSLDRPFIIMLVKSDTILFEGIVADLKGQNLTGSNESETKIPDEPSATTSRSSLDVPTESSEVSKPNITFTTQTEKNANNTSEQGNGNPDSLDDNLRSWWIPSAVPVYLTQNKTDDKPLKDLQSPNITRHIAPKDVSQGIPETATTPQTSSPVPNSVLLPSSKFQQPEPKDANGIRFPATVVQSRKSEGKLRSSESRNSLHDIMYLY